MNYTESGGNGMYPPDESGEKTSWSGMFGSFLPCVAQGNAPIEITGVHWESSEATEPLSVTTYVRTFDTRRDMPIGSALGTPSEPAKDSLFDTVEVREGVEGLEVSQRCLKDDEVRPDGILDEIVLVVESSPAGADLEHVSFTYRTPDGKEYEVITDWTFYLCGSKIPAALRCSEG